MGFITTGDGDVTIRGRTATDISSSEALRSGSRAPPPSSTATRHITTIQRRRWSSTHQAQRRHAHRADYVRFAIPTIHADQAKAIIGQIIFKFNCEVDGKQVMFNSRGIIIEDVLNTEIVRSRYTYQQSQETYNTASPGGVFNLVENLPDISQIDFHQGLVPDVRHVPDSHQQRECAVHSVLHHHRQAGGGQRI